MANDLDDLFPVERKAPSPPAGTYKTDRPAGPSDLDVVTGRAPADPNDLLRRKLEDDRRKFGDWARYAGQEVLLGAGDELGAGIAALTTLPKPGGPSMGETYTDELSDWRRRANRYQREDPKGALGTAAITALPAAAPVVAARLPQGIGVLGRMAAQAGLGAGYGAAHGFASGEGGPGDRLTHGMHEGVWGAGLGASLPLASAAIGGARRLGSPLLSGEGPGSRLMERVGMGPSGRQGIVDRLMRDELRPLPSSTLRPDPLPGTEFKPTPAQLLADPRLRALETQLLGADEVLQQGARQRDVVQRAAEPLLPGPRLTNAEMDLETARSLIQPSLIGDTPALSATRLHQGLTDLRDRARATISTAFDKLDMPNIDLPTDPLKKNFKAMTDSFSALAGERDVLPPKLLKAIDELGPTTTMEELQRLRSRLLSDARAEDLGTFERRVYNRAAGEVLDAMEVGIEKMGPGSGIIKRQYQKARDLTRQMKETFDNERVGHLFDSDYAPSQVGAELFTGKGARERIEALMKMSQDNPRVTRAMRDWLGHDLSTSVAGKEGDAAAKAMDRWFKKHEDLFQLNPQLGEDFLKIADAHRLATDLGRRQALVEEIQKGGDPEKLVKKYGPDLDRLFPDADERKLVEALAEAGRMMNLRGGAGVRSDAIRRLQGDDFMKTLTDDGYGLLGKLATMGPLGKLAYKGPQEEVLELLRNRVQSGNPADFLKLQPREKLGPRLIPPTPATLPIYDYARDRSRER
jgi:hypothetical protein